MLQRKYLKTILLGNHFSKSDLRTHFQTRQKPLCDASRVQSHRSVSMYISLSQFLWKLLLDPLGPTLANNPSGFRSVQIHTSPFISMGAMQAPYLTLQPKPSPCCIFSPAQCCIELCPSWVHSLKSPSTETHHFQTIAEVFSSITGACDWVNTLALL